MELLLQIVSMGNTSLKAGGRGEAGILAQGARVELIEREIVELVPIASHHAACVARLTHLFTLSLGNRTIVWIRSPARVILLDLSEPRAKSLRRHP